MKLVGWMGKNFLFEHEGTLRSVTPEDSKLKTAEKAAKEWFRKWATSRHSHSLKSQG